MLLVSVTCWCACLLFVHFIGDIPLCRSAYENKRLKRNLTLNRIQEYIIYVINRFLIVILTDTLHASLSSSYLHLT